MNTTEEMKYTEVGECSKRIVESERMKTNSSSVKGLEKTETMIVKGWNSVKSGAQKFGARIKKTDLVKKTSESIGKLKKSDLSRRVKESALSAGRYMKKGIKKTGKVLQKGTMTTKAKLAELTSDGKHQSNENTLIEVTNHSDVYYCLLKKRLPKEVIIKPIPFRRRLCRFNTNLFNMNTA